MSETYDVAVVGAGLAGMSAAVFAANRGLRVVQVGSAGALLFSSGLLGMVNGSAIANVVTTGAFTIPLMKRSGFKLNWICYDRTNVGHKHLWQQLMPRFSDSNRN